MFSAAHFLTCAFIGMLQQFDMWKPQRQFTTSLHFLKNGNENNGLRVSARGGAVGYRLGIRQLVAGLKGPERKRTMSHTRMKGLEKYCHPSAAFEDRISVADVRVVEAQSDVHEQIAVRLLVDITTLGPRLEWLDENGGVQGPRPGPLAVASYRTSLPRTDEIPG